MVCFSVPEGKGTLAGSVFTCLKARAHFMSLLTCIKVRAHFLASMVGTNLLAWVPKLAAE